MTRLLRSRVSLNQPTGLALDLAGNLYIADTYNNLVRVVAADGMIRTIAGNRPGETSDNGAFALSTNLNKPAALATNGNGFLYLADTGNARICQVDAIGASSAPLLASGRLVSSPSTSPSPSFRTVLTQVVASAMAQAGNGILGFTIKDSSKVGLLDRDGTLTYYNPNPILMDDFSFPGIAVDTHQNFLVPDRSGSGQFPGSGGFEPFAAISSISTAGPPPSQFVGRAETQGIVLTLALIPSLGIGSLGGNTVSLLSFGSSALQLSTQLLTAGESLLGLLGTVAFTSVGNENDPETDGEAARGADEDHPPAAMTPEDRASTDPWTMIRKLLGADDRLRHDLEALLSAPSPAATQPASTGDDHQGGAVPASQNPDAGSDSASSQPPPTISAGLAGALVDSALDDLAIVGGSLADRFALDRSNGLDFGPDHNKRDRRESWAGIVVTLAGLPTWMTLAARPIRRRNRWLMRYGQPHRLDANANANVR